jgi:DNA-binding Lrp family transcriptional regulator
VRVNQTAITAQSLSDAFNQHIISASSACDGPNLHGFSCKNISNFGINITLFTQFGTEKTMKESRLDRIDLKIIAELQADGRMTNVDLAQRVGISAPPCLRRVRALEKAGFIKGYHASVDGQMLGFGVTVFAMVGLDSQAESDLQAFEKRVNEWPEVRECHMLNGEIDFILKCVASDLASFQEFLTQKLTSAPNVAHVRTSLTIRQSKHAAGMPINLTK